MSWLDKLHEAQAAAATRNRDLGARRWNVCAARSATMASSELLRSCSSTSLRSLSAVEGPRVPPFGETNGRAGLDGCAGPGPHAPGGI